jgi:hypothetical protein
VVKVMNWIKRNLYFVIGAVVSLGLLGFAGYYNYTGWKHNTDAREERIRAYEELKRLNNQPVHPGAGKVDNIKAAREQQKQVREMFARIARNFESPPAIPATEGGTTVSSSQFNAALRETINELSRDAANASVVLPPEYSFSFSQQLRLLTFAPGSLEPLSSQLGEIKVLCDVLIKAKVNSLDAIQRARVSPDDYTGPAGDYVGLASVSNELAVLTPYQITFRSFTPEIAEVLAGFANSPYGIVVKSINVEPAASLATEQATASPYAVTPYSAPPVYSQPGTGYSIRGGALRPNTPAPVYRPPPTYIPSAGSRPGAPMTIVEQPLRVTLLIDMVKLLPHP